MVHAKSTALIILAVYCHSLHMADGLRWQNFGQGQRGQPWHNWQGGYGSGGYGQWGNWGPWGDPGNNWGQREIGKGKIRNGDMVNGVTGDHGNHGQGKTTKTIIITCRRLRDKSQIRVAGQTGDSGSNNQVNNGYIRPRVHLGHLTWVHVRNQIKTRLFLGTVISSLWHKGLPFYLIFLSTMVSESKGIICPHVHKGTPEYFSDQTNRISDPEYLKELYSMNPAPTTALNAQDFFRNFRPNGQHQFQPPESQDIGDHCMNIPPCDPNSTLRTLTGQCNNERFPMWGVTGVNLVHIVPAHYEDKKDKIRKDSSNKPLVSARKLQLDVISSNPRESKTISYAFMIFSQLISHDTGGIMNQHPVNKPTCLCCTSDGQMIPENQRAKVCHPIRVPNDDPFYSQFNVTCLHFVRSLTTSKMDCIIEPDQKLAGVSHYVDASVVYGSTTKKCDSLREFKDGRLKAEFVDGREFMPSVVNPETTCYRSPTCFAAGDDRVNQNNQLAVLHLMLFRFHNIVCKELLKLNPHWNDERIFQTARFIVIAVFQHITYEEMLPVLIGKEFAVSQNLSGINTLRNDLYNQSLNPGTLVEYTSSAARLLHMMVPSKVKLFNKDGTMTEEHSLSHTFFKPHILKKDGKLDQLVYGMVYQPANEINTGVTPELANMMFKSGRKHGLDLIAMDIERGRDHGVTIYGNLRGACGLSVPKSFADLAGIMSPENIEKLKHLYTSVNDIDAYVGMYMEFIIPGTLTGPLMRCLFTEQFKRWQAGDKFFYTFSNSKRPLNEDQLKEIVKTSLSMLFCLGGDHIEQMPVNSFLVVRPGNDMVPCDQIQKMSFLPWKEST